MNIEKTIQAKEIPDIKEVRTENSATDKLTIYKLIWIFTIGSIGGFIIETIWYFYVNGYYVCRKGLLYGPFSPIYGFGALIVTIFLYRIRNKSRLYIFICSGLIGSTFEFIASVLQESFVGTRSWNYSNTPFNLDGRINLQMGIVWGLLGCVFIHNIYPYLSTRIEKIPVSIKKQLTLLLTIFLIFDMTISVAAVKRQSMRREGKEATNIIEQFLDTQYPDEYIDSIYTRVRVTK